MPPTAVLDRPTILTPVLLPAWSRCWICGKTIASPSNDCGSTDQQHRTARGQ